MKCNYRVTVMASNYYNLRHQYFRYIFVSVCLIATVAFNILCISQYLENRDLCEIDYKTFNTDKDQIYPSVSICINNPFIEQSLAQYGQGITINKYRRFLRGEFWDSRMLNIDYDNVTFALIDNVIEYGFQYPNWTWFWYRINDEPSKAVSKPYISYRSSDDKCFAMDIKFRLNVKILRLGLRIKSKLFPNSIRPDRWVLDKQGFQVYLHYPHQFVRSYAAGIGKWDWPSREIKTGVYQNSSYSMDLIVENIDVMILRDKPNQDQPCDVDWLNYDYNVWKSAIDQLGCRHPVWNHPYTTYPLCSSKEDIQKAMPPEFEDLLKYPICCRRIEKAQFGYYEYDMEDDERKIIEGAWFELKVKFGDSIYKEITKVRKFDYQSLIG